MRLITLMILFLVSEILSGQQLYCSAFVLTRRDILLAKNFDWESGYGLIILNSKGETKKSVYGNGSPWISEFRSITFNHLGLQQPLGGMNEAGLTIEELSTWPVDYSINERTPGLTEFEWIQYHLDKYSTVKEVISNINNSSILKFCFNIHYILADATGDAAVIEFINKKPVIYRKGSLPFIILTNNNYGLLQRYLNRVPESHYNNLNMNNSQDRYLKIYSLLDNSSPSDSLREYISAVSILDSVSIEDTRWSLVYDITNRDIYFKTNICKSIQILSFPNNNTTFNHWRYCPIDSQCQLKFVKLTEEDNSGYLRMLKKDIINLKGSDSKELIRKIEQYLE